MKLKFYWNGGIAGSNYSFLIDNKMVELYEYPGFAFCDENEARHKIVEILKDEYDIDYNINDIHFCWGGRL